MDWRKSPKGVKYLFWYAGYGFAASWFCLHLWQVIFYTVHYSELSVKVKSYGVTSRVFQEILIDNIVIAFLFTTSMLFLSLLVWQALEIVGKKDERLANTLKLILLFVPGFNTVGIVLQAVYQIYVVYNLELGNRVADSLTEIAWHKFGLMASLNVMIISSALLMHETPLSLNNRGFSALLFVAFTILVSFNSTFYLYFWVAGAAIMISACHLQWQLSNIEEQEADIYEEEP